MYKTVLARVLDRNAQYSRHIYTVVTLVKLPREMLRVYNGQLTEEQFNALKDNAAFVLIEKNEALQLPMISKVMNPHASTDYQKYV